MDNKQSLYSLTLEELQNLLVKNNFAKYAADQIYHWIYKNFKLQSDDWSNTSKKMRQWLVENYDTSIPEVVTVLESVDGTRKFLFKLGDGELVEAVTIPMPGRLTICVSSQVGCAVGCKFCRTALMGFKRNLDSSEIIGQYLSATLWLREKVDPSMLITNIVYMGQGEPLLNFVNVKTSVMVFLEDKGISIGQRRITLSTSGIASQIEKLIDFPSVNLAVSLHAADDLTRDLLMPINKKYNMERLLDAINQIPLKANRRITYEYLLVDKVNDRMVDVENLTRILKRKLSKINLIPFNSFPGCEFKTPSKEKVVWFQEQLLNRDFVCTIRSSKGEDILAACGQLKADHCFANK